MLVNGRRHFLPVGGIPGNLTRYQYTTRLDHRQAVNLQPVDLPIMSETEDKLINNAIDAHSPTHQL